MKDTKERLDGWKQIAQYLHRDVTTVIRWEREKGLPVQRIPGGKRQSVFAYREDIDHWLSRPCQNGNPPPIGYDAPFVSERVENASSPSETAFNVAPEIAQGLNEQTGSGNPLPTGKTSDPLNKQEFPHAEFLIPQSSLLSPRGLLTRLLVPLLVCLVGTGAASWVLFFRWPSSIPKISKITAITNDGVEKGLLPFTDGSRIYFEESFPAKGAVKAVSTAGGDVIDIPMPIKNPFLVNIAPDGSGLLIANYYSPGPELWKVPLLGGSPRPVFGIHSVYVDWSPSRQKFVYVEDEGHTLSVAGLNGTGGQKLVTLSSQSISSPRWSPDGKIIRFVSTDPSHTGYMSELWEIESDGSKPRPLLAGWNSPPRESAGNWSVDGKFYVFSSQRDGRSDIWAISKNRQVGFPAMHINPCV